MTQDAKPLTAEEIGVVRRHVDCTEYVCDASKPQECEQADALSNREAFLATIDQQAAELLRLQHTSAFGSAVLRDILADTSFFESEESEQWCELLERHGYVERGIWDSAKHGESNVLGDGDEAWIFTEKSRRDAAGPSAAPSNETLTIAYWRRNAHEALDRMIEAQVAARLSGGGESDAYLQVHNETMFLAQQVVNHVTNARLAAARSENG